MVAATTVLAAAAVIGLIIRPFKRINDMFDTLGQKIDTKTDEGRKEAIESNASIGQDIKDLGSRLERRMDGMGQRLDHVATDVAEVKGTVPQMTARICNLEQWRNLDTQLQKGVRRG